MSYHTTVLLHEGVDALLGDLNGTYVDVTFGGGGHSRLILDKIERGRLIAFDQDQDAHKNAPDDERFTLINGNFRFLENFLMAQGATQVDGILADLGVSGYQFDEAERGFSFRFEATIDMRMNKSQSKSAVEVVNEYEYDQLKRVLKDYGETSFAAVIAKKLVQQRAIHPIKTIQDFLNVVEPIIPERKRKSELAKVFQAIRIEVNDEMTALKDFLQQAANVLKPGGKLVVISYHSLEDRPVKHFFRSGNFEDRMQKDLYGKVLRPLEPMGKVIKPSENEIEENPRARSAKMRIAIKPSNG